MTPTPTGIEARVCADIATRQQAGITKYGTTVADNPLTLKEWLQHAYEECLDQAIYLKRALSQLPLLAILLLPACTHTPPKEVYAVTFLQPDLTTTKVLMTREEISKDTSINIITIEGPYLK